MESRVEILYVCHRFPYPPRRGGKIRPFNMIRHLSERHRVTVASLVRSEAEATEGRSLEDHCEEILAGRVSEPWQTLRMIARLPTRTPSSMGYFFSRQLQHAIRETLARLAGGPDRSTKQNGVRSDSPPARHAGASPLAPLPRPPSAPQPP
jgi:hypothetical protein